jgi:hypothetical protein
MVFSFFRKRRGRPIDHQDFNAVLDAVEDIGNNRSDIRSVASPLTLTGTALGVNSAALTVAPTSRLDYVAGADLANGAALTTGVWTDLIANQSFTLGSTGSWLAVNIRLAGLVFCSSGVSEYAFRAMFDSSTSLVLTFAGAITISSQYGPMLGGQLYLPPSYFAASGSHTIKLQIVCGSPNTFIYLRPSSAGTFEQVAIRILELHQ